jgi:hypothetical protein
MILVRHVMLQEASPANVPTGPDNKPPHEFSHRRYLVPLDKDSEQTNVGSTKNSDDRPK